MTVTGHVILWASIKYGVPMSDEAAAIVEQEMHTDEDRQALRRLVLEHGRDIAERHRESVEMWDVLNEHFSEHEISKITHPDDPQRDPLLVELFKTVHEADPEALLLVNDFHIVVGDKVEHKDSYERLIRFLLEHDAPLGGIGMQSHYHNGDLRRTPQQLLDTLDRFGQFGLPIHLSEFDTFGGNWGDTQDDIEAAQAEWLRTFYKVAFSHEATMGITMWGFWDGRHWNNSAPLFRQDWSKKPGFDAYFGLVFEEWQTDVLLQTDADGKASFRGFFGTYAASVGQPTHQVELTRDQPTTTVQVRP